MRTWIRSFGEKLKGSWHALGHRVTRLLAALGDEDAAGWLVPPAPISIDDGIDYSQPLVVAER